ncbi:NAD-dependent epimerase/dehydratase family protein [Nakamurella deserti]|uniref:NAD-dependent epimerase/dehydratase family protein n=1 Tax=Nakamurella deserti TaxID=2164074 RepID=UPI000DBE640C|nr:NAD-dependent epimerase/dehydratase family protein [Nakamurella deserti]
MKLVIIGASGNIGTALLRRCAQDAELTVVGVSRRRPPAEPPYDVSAWVPLDVAGPSAAGELAEAFADADAVVNLAWGFQPSRDEAYLEAVGVGGLRSVLSAAVAAGVPHVVHMSSVGAYGPGSYGVPVDESFPTTGIPTSPYSRHKSAAEHVLDVFEREHPDLLISRARPGLVMSPDAGSSLLRYGLPPFVPGRLVGLLPVLPLDGDFRVPVVHADDVAAALLEMVRRRAGGAFNLAAPTPLDRALIARAMHARPLPMPRSLLRGLVTAGWRLHLERLDPGWIDLAFSVPLMRTDRAREVLDWTPRIDTAVGIAQVVDAMTQGAGTASPVLRRRSVRSELGDLRRGAASRRRLT